MVCHVSISFSSGGEEVADFHKFPEKSVYPLYIYISHKTKGCDIWPPLKSQFGKRFLTGSIVLYSFELLNVSIIYTNISYILRVFHVNILDAYCTSILRLITLILSERLDLLFIKKYSKFHYKRTIALSVITYQNL